MHNDTLVDVVYTEINSHLTTNVKSKSLSQVESKSTEWMGFKKAFVF